MLHVDAVVDWTKSEFVALTRNTSTFKASVKAKLWHPILEEFILSSASLLSLFYVDFASAVVRELIAKEILGSTPTISY